MMTRDQHPFIKLIKHLFRNLHYQLTRFYFFIVPRFMPRLTNENFGINFIGYAHGELGLGQAMRSLVLCAHVASIPFMVRKFKVNIPSRQSNDELSSYFSEHCQHPINIICVNPDKLHLLPNWINYGEWAKTYNIGYWFWELENFPKKWQYATHIVDEIWVATEYIANAMRKSGKKVVKIPFPLEFDAPIASINKDYFGIDRNKFTFLFSYDFLSSLNRKNPQGVINAFMKAFPGGNDSVRLVIKTMNAATHPAELKKLLILINSDPRIVVRDSYLSQAEMRGLIRSSDCYISLHRAEGLGLGLAEAMYMGIPTIATAYSGNLEFMNSSNSLLVPYHLVPIAQGEYPNGDGELWAEPNIDEAASAMRKIVDDLDFRQNLGIKASTHMQLHHSYARAASVIKAELERLRYK